MISQCNTSNRRDHPQPKHSETKVKYRQWWRYLLTGKALSLTFIALNLLGLVQYRRVMNQLVRETTIIYHKEQSMDSQSHQNARKHAKDINNGINDNIVRIQTHQFSSRGTEDPAGQYKKFNSSNFSKKAVKHHHHHSRHQLRHFQHLQNERILSSSTLSSNKHGSGGKFAYAFLLGAVMSTKQGADYRGGLYGIVVAAHNLRLHGSKADIVVMVQMSATTNATKLPALEESVLIAMNIKIKYIPKYSDPELECFYSLMMEKFRILQWEEYSRVLYLDADVLPNCNLDYMMELSEQGDVLRENVIISYRGEPSSGGFFVLKPNASDYKELIEIIRNTESKYIRMPYPHWDFLQGWGHVIDESDPWKSIRKELYGTNWTFYGSQADQGLLYYWTKYYKKSVSAIKLMNVDHWGVEPVTNILRLLRHDVDPLRKHMCTNIHGHKSGQYGIPYTNFVHLTGRSKPWYKNRTALEKEMNAKHIEKYNHEEYWYWLLKDALRKTGLHDGVSLNFIDQQKREKGGGIGKVPSFSQRAQYIQRKAKNGWRQYEYEEETNVDEGSDDKKNPLVTESAVPSRDSERQAHTLVSMLENFQPRTALKPHLTRIKALQNDLEQSLGSKILAGEGIASTRERNSVAVNANGSIDTRKWAYAFLLGGARSDAKGTDYLGGLYSVVVAAHQLRKLGSRADFVLMVQLSAKSPHQKLSDFEEEMLQKMNIKVVYIPKFHRMKWIECFYSLMMEKFRILTLTEYSRVMYLDYDIFPTCNLDYLFDLSDPLPSSSDIGSSETNRTVDAPFRMKENVIVAYKHEPSSGGLFILKPNASDYYQIQRIIQEHEMRSLELPYPHWDPESGWGHVITKPDYWKNLRGQVRSNWTWYGVQADQGLLYYWTKYVKKSVSIICRDDVQHWEPDYWDVDSNGTLFLRQTEVDVPKIVNKALKPYGCPKKSLLLAPYKDFFHLSGAGKPWYRTRQHLENPDCNDDPQCEMQANWYSVLKDALLSIEIVDRFSWDFLGTRKRAPVGHAPTYEQIANYIREKKKRNWNQYA